MLTVWETVFDPQTRLISGLTGCADLRGCGGRGSSHMVFSPDSSAHTGVKANNSAERESMCNFKFSRSRAITVPALAIVLYVAFSYVCEKEEVLKRLCSDYEVGVI